MVRQIQEIKNLFGDLDVDDHLVPLYVDERIVSKITGIAVQTLRNDRHRGRGIPYIKISKSVRYRLFDVVSFMDQHRILTQQYRKDDKL